jgi:hypothetical protein
MSRAAYSKRTCRCGKEVSAAGCAWHNHMMMHVRRKEAEVTFATFRNKLYTEFTWIKGAPCPSKSR